MRVKDVIMDDVKKLDNVTVGCDPELFLMRPDGKFISSIGLIGGSKLVPRPVKGGGAVQEDNVAVEFNIAPADKVETFVSRISHVLEYLTAYAGEKGLLLSVTAAKSFDEDQLKDPKALAFGCETDFNAWTKQPNDPPKAEDKKLRTTGGHVHIGGVEELDKIQLVRWCDVIMGCSSVLEDDIEGSLKRRELYGKAGCFRPKPYGVEYRTLSPYWIQDKLLMGNIFNRALEVVDRVQSGWRIEDDEGVDIQAAINNGDKELAEKTLTRYAVY